jgi:hypothetical protein
MVASHSFGSCCWSCWFCSEIDHLQSPVFAFLRNPQDCLPFLAAAIGQYGLRLGPSTSPNLGLRFGPRSGLRIGDSFGLRLSSEWFNHLRGKLIPDVTTLLQITHLRPPVDFTSGLRFSRNIVDRGDAVLIHRSQKGLPLLSEPQFPDA